MTTPQKQMLDQMMPEIANLMASGLDPLSAVKEVLISRMDFCGEMAMQESSRSKNAMQYMFNQYCEIKGIN